MSTTEQPLPMKASKPKHSSLPGPSASAPVYVTGAQVDEAIEKITGFPQGQYGWNRTTAALQAASRAWIEHSARLRAALRDLGMTGAFQFVDDIYF